jgi:hypothetical protein
MAFFTKMVFFVLPALFKTISKIKKNDLKALMLVFFKLIY